MVDLLAPSGSSYSGTLIASAYPGGGYGDFYGTSLAAPHVTGAYALLKQLRPDASVGEILYILQQTGVPVVDSVRDWGRRCGTSGSQPCSGLTYPRIDLEAAADALLNRPFLTRYTTSTPRLLWTRVTWAAGYQIEVDNNRDFLTPEFTGSTLSATDRDILTAPLANDLYYWRVRAVNGVTPGAWSRAEMFVVAAP